MADLALEERYRAYLACLNERRFGDLPGFVRDPVTHNGRRLSVGQFQELLRRDTTEIPDLFFAVERLVVQGNDVACRIRFDCTPAVDFRGTPSAGRAVSFVEHVFYRYEDGRIAEIWSVIDIEGIREQLSRSGPDQ
jgi:predicted ester cyclase